MIVPVLTLPTNFHELTDADQVAFSDTVKQAGLLGRVAVRVGADANVGALEKLLIAASGFCEIKILPDSDSFTDDFAFSMLNAGASHILATRLPEQTSVPTDRIQHAQQGVLNPQDCDPEQVAEEWKSENDWHVDGTDEAELG